MTLFVFIFLAIGIVTFSIVAFAIRPTVEEKMLQQRMATMTVTATTAAESEVSQLLKISRTGAFDWASEWLEGSKTSNMLRQLLLQSNSSTTEGAVIVTALGLGIAATMFAYAFTSMLLVAFGAGLAGGAVPLLMLRFKRNGRIKAFDKAMPDCVDMISRSLRAGHSLQAALGIVAEQAIEPAKREFSEVFKQQSYGMPMRDALLQLLERVPSQDLRVLVTGMLVQKDTGGNLAEMLDKIVAVIRERMRIKGEIQVHTAQGRLTGWILCALPVVMLLLINVINPGYSKVLFTTDLGHKILYIGIGLLGLGGLIIRGIIKGIEV